MEFDKVNAIIRVHFNKNPDDLADEEYYQLYQQWVYVENIKKNAYKEALIEVLQLIKL